MHRSGRRDSRYRTGYPCAFCKSISHNILRILLPLGTSTALSTTLRSPRQARHGAGQRLSTAKLGLTAIPIQPGVLCVGFELCSRLRFWGFGTRHFVLGSVSRPRPQWFFETELFFSVPPGLSVPHRLRICRREGPGRTLSRPTCSLPIPSNDWLPPYRWTKNSHAAGRNNLK
jgi:hypothetical protein